MMVAREISCATSSLHGHNVTDFSCRSQFHWRCLSCRVATYQAKLLKETDEDSN